MQKEFLQDLNEEQLRAATTLEGHLLVIAGAGTGKTKMLISRVANLLSEGVAPENILLLTFTKKAAQEMRDRVASFPSIEDADRITASTFHAFCCETLHKYAYLLGFKNDFTTLPSEDAEDVIGRFAETVRREYKAKGKKLPKFPSNAEIQNIHCRHISEMKNIDEVCDEPNISLDPMYKKDVINILKQFNEYKKEHDLMDFDDLLYWTYILFRKRPEVRHALDAHYRYIMADEYQDTNIIQDKLLDLLSIDYPNLCVVGDDNQCWTSDGIVKLENGITKRVDQLNVGDRVQVISKRKAGYSAVTAVTRQEGKIVKFTTNTGRVLKVTTNHRMFVKMENPVTTHTYGDVILYMGGSRYSGNTVEYQSIMGFNPRKEIHSYKYAWMLAQKVAEDMNKRFLEKLVIEDGTILDVIPADKVRPGMKVPVIDAGEIVLETVMSIVERKPTVVFDIEVAECGNMCVNGIVSHNSIYKFRAAHIGNILTFSERHGNCPVIKLTRNYRSTQEILDYANAVMEHASEGIKKRLVGFSNGEAVKIKVADNDFSLSDFIIDDIQKKISDGTDPRQICIMGRHGDTTQIVETQLQRAHIPFQKFGGKSFFAQAVVRDILSFLRAGNSIDDEIAWFRLLPLIPGVGMKKAEALYKMIKEDGVDVLVSMDMMTDKSAEYFEELHKFLAETSAEPPVDQIAVAADMYKKMKEATIEAMRTTEDKRDKAYSKLYKDAGNIETLKYLAVNYV